MKGEGDGERRPSAWDAIFGGPAQQAMNRKERRAMEKDLARSIRRNQRAYARRMKEQALNKEDGNGK